MKPNMASKFQQLREGKAVEIEPGVSGRLDRENKTLQLSNGEVLNVANDRDFFPSSEKEINLSKQKEHIEKGISRTPLGEFGYQFSQKGLLGGARDWIGYLTQNGEEYATRKKAEREVSDRISEESPYTSAAATAASFVPDIAATGTLPAVAAAPLLAAGSAGSRIVTEPKEVAGEVAASAAMGYGIDKVGKYLNRVANRRAAVRSLPEQQQAVRNQNIAGKQATEEFNRLQTQDYNYLKQNTKNINEYRLQQHAKEVNTRQNKMIASQNAYEKAKYNRDVEVIQKKNQAEIAKANRSKEASTLQREYLTAKAEAESETRRLSQEFKEAQASYQESLKKLPELQRQAQKVYGENVIRNAKEIEGHLPKNAKISVEEIGVPQFVDEGINKTGLAGSREGTQARRILQSIFPEGEMIGSRELSRRYQALEEAIQRSPPEVQAVLNQFKRHLGGRLPSIVENAIVYNKVMPLLKKSLNKEIDSILSEISFSGRGMEGAKDTLSKFAKTNVNNLLAQDLTPIDFMNKLKSGEVSRELANKILTVEDFLVDFSPSNIKFMQKQGTFTHVFEDAQRKHAYFVNQLQKKIEPKIRKYETKALQLAQYSGKKVRSSVKKTFGLAEEVLPPVPPSALSYPEIPLPPKELSPIPAAQLPNPVVAPETPPIPVKPSLMQEPTLPIPQSFTPQGEPALSPARGSAEGMGDLLEKNLLGGKGIVNNPLAKLAGLRYLLGKAALPVEAGYAAAKLLTSPTELGQAARITFKQGGIEAINSWAQRYQSYHNGILEDPRERRSLTKEIEDDPEISIEKKALIQSMVNRGKPLQ